MMVFACHAHHFGQQCWSGSSGKLRGKHVGLEAVVFCVVLLYNTIADCRKTERDGQNLPSHLLKPKARYTVAWARKHIHC
jgi:hypothetical protein